jgi:hypothetical protein
MSMVILSTGWGPSVISRRSSETAWVVTCGEVIQSAVGTQK